MTRPTVQVFALLLVSSACATHGTVPIFAPASRPSVEAVRSPELAYFLSQLEIASESPAAHLLPDGLDWEYKIVAATEQGNCVGGCPRSTIFIAISNYYHLEPDVRLYRVDGIRFWTFIGIAKYAPAPAGEAFLVFNFISRDQPNTCVEYEVRVSEVGAEVVQLGPNLTLFACK